MYHDRPRATLRARLARWAAALLALALLALGGAVLARRVGRDLDDQGAAALRQAVLDAAVQCYAVEGKYPESLDRLERDYGVQINHDRYIVTYDVFASNQLPDVQVLQK